jgi:hypothetical protein
MERWGDGHKPMWATEWGWLMSPAVEGQLHCLTRPEWQESSFVEEATAASYLAEAVELARRDWPWMEVMFLFNLDFSMAPWYTDRCEPMLYHAILNRDGSRRLPFDALQAAFRRP